MTKASLNKSSNKLIKLEADSMSPDTFSVAQGLASKLKSLDTEFKTYQLAITDLTDDDDGLAVEQQELHNHNDHRSDLVIHIQRLVSTLLHSMTDGLCKP